MMQTLSRARNYTTAANLGLAHTFRYKFQDQLYIHQLNNGVSKLSFSEDPDSIHVGTLSGVKDEQFKINTSNFKENRSFLPVLHQAFKENVFRDQSYIYDALNYNSSYMAIGDYKVILDYMNQRPDLSNTLGFVRVNDDGVIDPGSYEKNDMYTLCNIDGIIKITDFMNEELQKYLK